MNDDNSQIVATAHDYFDGYFDGDVARMEHMVRTRDGWKIANALFCSGGPTA